ncbi:uncharacterized protein LOC129774278 [Toxorhynchites rutilus septentrionalis]|uniref:uncharacterized protein LOC129774278 n=1 Tax=Toxorhynchites rutilus septentrionalis TaxID=329112 RepID=UPI00247B18C8|nr:uncharacterized protein LOC129774278 [Toxorhynchites rutilus septentrionalis]
MPPTTRNNSLKALLAKLKALEGMFNDICRFVNSMDDDTLTTEATVRLDKLDELWEQISEATMDIEMHEDFEEVDDTYPTKRSEFGDRYFKTKSLLLEKVKDPEVKSNPSIRGIEQNQHSTYERVRLPQIKLQTFDGNIDEWLSFRDLYISLIHCKSDLPEVEKFHYLKGCLVGEARSLVDSLAITKANYKIAWEAVMKRYNDSKLLKRRQVQALFNLPNVAKESVVELQSLLEAFERILQTLDQLIQPAEYKDLLLLDLLCSRLDPTTRRSWEEHSATIDQDTVKDLTDFLQKRIRVLSSLPTKSIEPKLNYVPQPKRKLPTQMSHSASQSSSGQCVACPGSHLLYQCPKFQSLPVSARDKLLRSLALCRNCFRRGHQATECNSRYVCRNCKGKHHTLVCFRPEEVQPAKRTSEIRVSTESSSKGLQHNVEDNTPSTSSGTIVVTSNTASKGTSSVLLATAVVLVVGENGITYPARALLDSGSECNFMSDQFSQLLRIKRNRAEVAVSGVGQVNTRVTHSVKAEVRSRVGGYSCNLEFLILPKVTGNLPSTCIDTTNWKIPHGITLADPAFAISKSVDLILGIQQFFTFFKPGKEIHLGDGLPKLSETVFGWVVAGTVISSSIASYHCNVASTVNLEELLTRFWSCEEVVIPNNYSPEETLCEEQFVRTVRRDSNGRYKVSLPKDANVMDKIGESRDIALRRFQWLERRLLRDSELRCQYTQFMEEYIHLGHMRRVRVNQDNLIKRCYLPHHPVIKQTSTTTKLRVVFDASCKTSSGISLNDALLAGPVIQEDLRSIILRCRTKRIMLVADVEKMFRQIIMDEGDQPLQSILWRTDTEQEIGTYELSTVTYGTKPAPFLATRTLKQLADDEQTNFPQAAKAINEDVYMDDVLTGTNNVKEAVDLRVQLEALMRSGGFKLRKWVSNCEEVLHGVPEEDLALGRQDHVELDPDPAVRMLGLTWLPKTDGLKLQFSVPEQHPTDTLSKRMVLSIIAGLFDPLGLVGAVITVGKLFMQRLWKFEDANGRKLDWDSPIPSRPRDEWREFHRQLPILNTISIKRCVLVPDPIIIELHVFSDASEKAYGACAYLKSCNLMGTTHIALLSSKSKVAPLKTQSIPRLELCGALLATQLAEQISTAIKINPVVYFWTDSTCVLQWIRATPSTWTTFVANRVAKIQQTAENRTWNHIPGCQNPADLISRGVLPEEIIGNNLWWEGPSWLRESQRHWPIHPVPAKTTEAEAEFRQSAVSCATLQQDTFTVWYLSKFSSFTDLVRRTAYWLRLMNILKQQGKKENSRDFLTTSELVEAEYAIIRSVQKEEFKKEWKALSKGEPVTESSPLRWFNPTLSAENLIRVGGRLEHSLESVNRKHPIVLPARHPITRMIFEHFHKKLLHAGPQLLLATVRQRYWPLRGRNLARFVYHNCNRCARLKPTQIQQFMGDLPAARVTPGRPFIKVGVDYFGPVFIRHAPRRPASKAYVAVFVCMCTKAVHLEMVTDLSTDRFIQALRRFVGRRGKCSDIFSDNGTNFVGARNQLGELSRFLRGTDNREKITRECANEGIQWHFNPPSAPHFGGLWEAAVKSAKIHLMKVLGDSVLSFEDMSTLLVQVECCLNSRPLIPMSEDPNELEPLTPGHFLIGTSLQQLPEMSVTDIPMNRLKQWQATQKILQCFWKRWRTEYLAQLQGRTKRWQPPIQIVVGQLVVIRDENLPPTRWKMGRIIQLHPGMDGVVRVVTLRTATGLLKRPVEKICLLPPACQPCET